MQYALCALSAQPYDILYDITIADSKTAIQHHSSWCLASEAHRHILKQLQKGMSKPLEALCLRFCSCFNVANRALHEMLSVWDSV